ncbi:MAG: DegT/DnrJ/EryC1/StrS family aminotransferase [Gammaproteobacteria bacterium]
MIPFLDLQAVNAPLREELAAASRRVIDSGWYVLGEEVAAFEQEFAQYCGAKHCIGVANGLDALTLMLRAAVHLQKLRAGDEIIIPANTYIATVLAALQAGLLPRLVEPDADTHNLCPRKTAAAMTPQTRAIMAVHLYGQAAPMPALSALAAARGLLLFADAAQAHGAQSGNRPISTFGSGTAFSFYPGKNLGALGDGGAVVCDDDELAEKIRTLRNYGSARKYENDLPGINSRLDELQAALLRVKLPRLEADNARRRRLAKRYAAGINNPWVQTPAMPAEEMSHSWHLFVIRSKWRDKLAAHLRQAGIGTLIHYPIPPHRQKAFSDTSLATLSLPLSEQLANEVLSLPLSPALSDDEAKQVIEAVNAFGAE